MSEAQQQLGSEPKSVTGLGLATAEACPSRNERACKIVHARAMRVPRKRSEANASDLARTLVVLSPVTWWTSHDMAARLLRLLPLPLPLPLCGLCLLVLLLPPPLLLASLPPLEEHLLLICPGNGIFVFAARLVIARAARWAPAETHESLFEGVAILTFPCLLCACARPIMPKPTASAAGIVALPALVAKHAIAPGTTKAFTFPT